MISHENSHAPAAHGKLLAGVRAMATHTDNPERRMWHFVQEADAAIEAGEDDGSKVPFFRRGSMIFSWTGWLDRWFSGELVPVARGDPKQPGGRGRPRKVKAPTP